MSSQGFPNIWCVSQDWIPRLLPTFELLCCLDRCADTLRVKPLIATVALNHEPVFVVFFFAHAWNTTKIGGCHVFISKHVYTRRHRLRKVSTQKSSAFGAAFFCRFDCFAVFEVAFSAFSRGRFGAACLGLDSFLLAAALAAAADLSSGACLAMDLSSAVLAAAAADLSSGQGVHKLLAISGVAFCFIRPVFGESQESLTRSAINSNSSASSSLEIFRDLAVSIFLPLTASTRQQK